MRQQTKHHTIHRSIYILTSLLIVLGITTNGCATMQKTKKTLSTPTKNTSELDFIVHNKTGITQYITCFSYIKKEDFTRWHWDKSDVYTVKDNQKITIDIDTIPDAIDRKNVYGYLATFTDPEKAEEATLELVHDDEKIDLDLLYKLKDKTVVLEIEKYGFKGKRIDYHSAPTKHDGEKKIPELDFIVENQTEKTIYVTAFVYQLKKNLPVWQFDKTPVVRIESGKSTLIDVDTIASDYNRMYVRGYLGIFDESEKEQAESITYELLEPQHKVKLGALFALKNKKVVLSIEQYGVVGDTIDYTIKPIRRISFGRKNVKERNNVKQDVKLKAWR